MSKISREGYEALLEVAQAAKTYRECHWLAPNVRALDRALERLENVQPLVEGILLPGQDVVYLSDRSD